MERNSEKLMGEDKMLMDILWVRFILKLCLLCRLIKSQHPSEYNASLMILLYYLVSFQMHLCIIQALFLFKGEAIAPQYSQHQGLYVKQKIEMRESSLSNQLSNIICIYCPLFHSKFNPKSKYLPLSNNKKVGYGSWKSSQSIVNSLLVTSSS